MKRLAFRFLPIVVLILVATAAHASQPGMPSFPRGLRGVTGITIPAAWAGVWQFADTTFVCGTTDNGEPDAGLDTLCAGAQFFDDGSGVTFDCTGSATDTQADFTCTGTFSIVTCTITVTAVSHATRDGDTIHYDQTTTTTYTPTLCAFQPDSCEHTSGVSTRVGPPPASCATPVEKVGWGTLKLRYR